MSRNQIKSVVILGGGTAGWLSALLLRENLGTELKITLIESPKKPIIGVGEATVPSIRFSMLQLGLAEDEWMPKVQGSFKLAVRFNDWLRKGHVYYHPFHLHKNFSSVSHGLYHLPDLPSHVDLLQRFASIPLEERSSDFARFSSSIPTLCDLNKSPRSYDGKFSVENYAYHFDTHLLNAFFKELGQKRNIEYIDDIFVSADLEKENGFIKNLNLESGKKVFGDLFIDCSGQQALLINGVLREEFLDKGSHLLQDSALAVQLPYENAEQEMHPYTMAQAMDSGWVWKIPLQHRIGTGYVYSSQFATEDQAWAEYQKLYPTRMKNLNPRAIKFKTGRHKRTWVKNCLALGLAGAFIEPLESTSIALTEYQIHSLIHLWPDLNFESHLRDRYNEKFNFCYDRVLDYIVLHYHLSQRRDTPFWCEVTQDNRLTNTLKDFLSEVKSYVAFAKPDQDWTFFQRFNFGCILSGMEALPYVNQPILNKIGSESFDQIYRETRKKEEELIQKLPSLKEYLSKMRKADSLAETL